VSNIEKINKKISYSSSHHFFRQKPHFLPLRKSAFGAKAKASGGGE